MVDFKFNYNNNNYDYYNYLGWYSKFHSIFKSMNYFFFRFFSNNYVDVLINNSVLSINRSFVLCKLMSYFLSRKNATAFVFFLKSVLFYVWFLGAHNFNIVNNVYFFNYFMNYNFSINNFFVKNIFYKKIIKLRVNKSSINKLVYIDNIISNIKLFAKNFNYFFVYPTIKIYSIAFIKV